MKRLILFSLCTLSIVAGCRSPYYADRGAGAGALAGAVTGALVGEHNGNPLAGAAIGTAVGALAGAAVGDVIDSEVARNNAIIQERMGRQLSGAVTTQDVVAMAQAGVPEDVMISHIRASGVARPLGVDEIITLTKSGVPPSAIKAMQAPSQPRVAQAAAVTPVVVEEHYITPGYYRPVHYPRYHYHHRRPYCAPPRRGVSWGVSVHR